MKYREALALAMQSAMEKFDSTIIIGQGVADFKGLFGTTLGLSDAYPERVIETPLSEDSISGICIGAALNGIYPINTHIRADFSLLTFNQLINLAAKYRYMFGGLFEVPMMVRMIIGRSWGQGAQHSQSLQSLLAHIPGLVVVMPSNPQSILSSYEYAVESYKGPVLMLEHRLMYELEFETTEVPLENPLFGSYVVRRGSDITVVATSIMVLEAKRAADYLASFGIFIEIIDLHSISHPDHNLILSSLRKTGRLIVADTSWTQYGVAAEINRIVNEVDPSILRTKAISLGMKPSPCPTAKALEDMFYAETYDIIQSACLMMNRSEDIPLPQRQSMTSFYKSFRGPF